MSGNAAWFAVPLALSLALAVGWKRAAWWTALLVAGQAAALDLYQAGTGVGYHHYRLGELTLESALPAGVLAAQAWMVALDLVPKRHAIRAWLARALPGWRAPALLAAMVVLSAKISRPATASAAEFGFATLVQLVQLGNAVLVAFHLPAGAVERLERLVGGLFGPPSARGEPEPGGVDAFSALAGLFAFASALALNVLAYERHPHVPDEVVYLLHARYLAAGHLFLPAPPSAAGFDLDLMLQDGERWFCPVPPGWPLVLAVGAFFGVPWLVNPLLGGLTVLATYALARELVDCRSARWIALLLAASPWFAFLNMSYMTHTWMLLCTVIGALGVTRARRTGSALWTLAGGAAAGMVSLIRPLEGLIVALSLGLWSIGLGGRRIRLDAIATLVLGTALVGALVFPYNAYLTGDALQFPINEYVDRVYGPGLNDMGFGPDKGLGWDGLDPWPGHSPFQALVNAQFNGFAIQAELFGWGVGSLVLVLFLLLGGRLDRKDRAMLAFAGLVVAANSCYWFAGGPDFGARYWYPVIVPLVVLSASGLAALEARASHGAEPARVRALVLLFVAGAWLTWVPWRATNKYFGYRGMHPVVRELDRRHDFGRSLVLVQGERHPEFASAAVYNPLDWEADQPVYAWDKDETTRAELLAHYRDRPVWTITREGEVIGPLSATELLEQAP